MKADESRAGDESGRRELTDGLLLIDGCLCRGGAETDDGTSPGTSVESRSCRAREATSAFKGRCVCRRAVTDDGRREFETVNQRVGGTGSAAKEGKPMER
ncbi:hypothetical protein G6O67_001962 [Ophiocordyceps sinensis]|uniref:Uncharacterized protein n=1 Tax=Ophiocordyceps sinensis TaxID=72228 RepID=A0A8H4V712_9HYPO|nr:hypothetical protein G6O67_001962 [Ophiocordyceps sinensis]